MSYILGLNIDHIATLRNARSEGYPHLMELVDIAINSGADQITAHLREDRRHIKDSDIYNLKNIAVPLNMEMAVTEEMLDIALKVKPHAVCLVPEKRSEITTEGGLDIITYYDHLIDFIKILQNNDIMVSLFIDAHKDNISVVKKLQPNAIEINTGKYANLCLNKQDITTELHNIKHMVNEVSSLGIRCHAGHGLNLSNISAISSISNIVEFNIGHYIISYALKVGLSQSIKEMKNVIFKSRS